MQQPAGPTRSGGAEGARKAMCYKVLALAGLMAVVTSGARGSQPEKPQAAETVWKFAAGG
jgi:hypothetical protein